MKTFDIDMDGYMRHCGDAGDWVRVEVAQELYDMLLYTLNEMEHNPILEADIQEVLTKANKGE